MAESTASFVIPKPNRHHYRRVNRHYKFKVR
jgi:hypothetical protein